MPEKRPRGFAAMNPEQQRQIASMGGRAAHQRGTAHEWDSREAAEAGRKGGKAAHRGAARTSAETNGRPAARAEEANGAVQRSTESITDTRRENPGVATVAPAEWSEKEYENRSGTPIVAVSGTNGISTGTV